MVDSAQDGFGYSVAGVGDVNGDGYDDWMVGAPYADATPGALFQDHGKGYLYLGGPTPNGVADFEFVGSAFGYQLGTIVTGGDFDGDGFSDIAIGNGTEVSVYRGGPSLDGTPELIVPGRRASLSGDVNNDGFADPVLVDGALVRVYFGGPGMDTTPDVSVGVSGASLAPAGDFNSDGFVDVVVSSGTLLDFHRYFLASPSPGTTWQVGERQSVEWTGAQPADVLLSADGGASHIVLAEGVGGARDNLFSIVVPHLPTRFARVRVRPTDPGVVGSADSDSLFTISASIALLQFTAQRDDDDPSAVRLSWSTDPGLESLAGYDLERSLDRQEWQLLAHKIRTEAFLDSPPPGAVPPCQCG
jgi:hypothetical protein